MAWGGGANERNASTRWRVRHIVASNSEGVITQLGWGISLSSIRLGVMGFGKFHPIWLAFFGGNPQFSGGKGFGSLYMLQVGWPKWLLFYLWNALRELYFWFAHFNAMPLTIDKTCARPLYFPFQIGGFAIQKNTAVVFCSCPMFTLWECNMPLEILSSRLFDVSKALINHTYFDGL